MSTLLRVSAESNPGKVAGAISGIVQECGSVELDVIGAGAVNQTVKAIALARGHVAPVGMELACIPSFIEIDIKGEARTGIRFLVYEVEKS